MKKLFFSAIIFMLLLTACGIPNAKNTASKVESEDFAGEWADESGGTTVIDLWHDENGVWHGEISRGDDDYTASFWSFTGNAAGNVLTYTDMKRTRGIYDEEGEVTEEDIYADGSGKLILKDGKLSWQDEKEGAGNGLTFIYNGEY